MPPRVLLENVEQSEILTSEEKEDIDHRANTTTPCVDIDRIVSFEFSSVPSDTLHFCLSNGQDMLG